MQLCVVSSGEMIEAEVVDVSTKNVEFNLTIAENVGVWCQQRFIVV